jgi:hypothetical protein
VVAAVGSKLVLIVGEKCESLNEAGLDKAVTAKLQPGSVGEVVRSPTCAQRFAGRWAAGHSLERGRHPDAGVLLSSSASRKRG